MFLFAAAAAVAIVWLWLFPPVGLSDRARAAWILALVVTAGGATWMTAAVMGAANGARVRAVERARQAEVEKQRHLDRVRDTLGPGLTDRSSGL
jgi:hypothetical protein